jgi:hypothetical protein
MIEGIERLERLEILKALSLKENYFKSRIRNSKKLLIEACECLPEVHLDELRTAIKKKQDTATKGIKKWVKKMVHKTAQGCRAPTSRENSFLTVPTEDEVSPLYLQSQ